MTSSKSTLDWPQVTAWTSTWPTTLPPPPPSRRARQRSAAVVGSADAVVGEAGAEASRTSTNNNRSSSNSLRASCRGLAPRRCRRRAEGERAGGACWRGWVEGLCMVSVGCGIPHISVYLNSPPFAEFVCFFVPSLFDDDVRSASGARDGKKRGRGGMKRRPRCFH